MQQGAQKQNGLGFRDLGFDFSVVTINGDISVLWYELLRGGFTGDYYRG